MMWRFTLKTGPKLRCNTHKHTHIQQIILCGDLTPPLVMSLRHKVPVFVPSAGVTYESFIKTGLIAQPSMSRSSGEWWRGDWTCHNCHSKQRAKTPACAPSLRGVLFGVFFPVELSLSSVIRRSSFKEQTPKLVS